MENFDPHLNNFPLKELPLSFNGRGEVKGFCFNQIERSNLAYIYAVCDTSGNKWYEVFQRRIDARFGNISYPKANSFGITAWSARTIEKAYSRFDLLHLKFSVSEEV